VCKIGPSKQRKKERKKERKKQRKKERKKEKKKERAFIFSITAYIKQSCVVKLIWIWVWIKWLVDFAMDMVIEGFTWSDG
jgi:hypothetical protein